jgi:hypothetical protein
MPVAMSTARSTPMGPSLTRSRSYPHADLNLDGRPDLFFADDRGVQILWNSELQRPTTVVPSTLTRVRRLFR